VFAYHEDDTVPEAERDALAEQLAAAWR